MVRSNIVPRQLTVLVGSIKKHGAHRKCYTGSWDSLHRLIVIYVVGIIFYEAELDSKSADQTNQNKKVYVCAACFPSSSVLKHNTFNQSYSQLTFVNFSKIQKSGKNSRSNYYYSSTSYILLYWPILPVPSSY